ncbi:hypothetical protein MRX96_036619 [Rhipicephalus microplus]
MDPDSGSPPQCRETRSRLPPTTAADAAGLLLSFLSRFGLAGAQGMLRLQEVTEASSVLLTLFGWFLPFAGPFVPRSFGKGLRPLLELSLRAVVPGDRRSGLYGTPHGRRAPCSPPVTGPVREVFASVVSASSVGLAPFADPSPGVWFGDVVTRVPLF